MAVVLLHLVYLDPFDVLVGTEVGSFILLTKVAKLRHLLRLGHREVSVCTSIVQIRLQLGLVTRSLAHLQPPLNQQGRTV